MIQPLLLHCNGTNGSQVFTDDGDTVHNIVANSIAQIDTSEKKFGTGSCKLDGGISHLSILDHTDWYLSTNKFTIDFWVRFTALPTNSPYVHGLFEQRNDASNRYQFYIQKVSSEYHLVFYFAGADGGGTLDTGPTGIAINTWYHIALIRGWGGVADRFAITLDGALVGSTMDDADGISNLTTAFTIGRCYYSGGFRYLNGRLDEYRHTEGARWDAPFTPDTEEGQHMAFTDQWNATFEASPPDDQDISLGDDRIREFKLAVRERMVVDHYWDPTGTDADHGEHLKISFNAPLGAYPTHAANKAFVYIKDVSSLVELHWTDESGKDLQITSAGVMLIDAGKADTIVEKTTDAGVTVDGVKLLDSEVYTDVIHEKTAATGVTIDSVLLKDGTVVSAALVDADGDTKIQVEESADEDIIRFDTGGTERIRIEANGSITKGTGCDACLIKTGTYTGNGAQAQAITGVGFSPKYLRIWMHPRATGDDDAIHYAFEKLDRTWGDYTFEIGNPSNYDHRMFSSRINSLDADGFTVDDYENDDHPNKNGITYDYLALG